MKLEDTASFRLYKECVQARHDGVLITKDSNKDKEFHFQNWCQNRLDALNENYDEPGRNVYPDFRLVNIPEGYEIKGLAYPGREKDYDSNSNLPTGIHKGRNVFYVFGRYPSKTEKDKETGKIEYPVVDLVICHGDFLNCNHDYVHKNKHVSCFGSYGDIMIRDRKMYVVPTPFKLAKGTAGLNTLILPTDYEVPDDFMCVGELVRVEANKVVIGYSFDLRNNDMTTETIDNPNAGKEHYFKAYRLKDEAKKLVYMNEANDEGN